MEWFNTLKTSPNRFKITKTIENHTSLDLKRKNKIIQEQGPFGTKRAPKRALGRPKFWGLIGSSFLILLVTYG